MADRPAGLSERLNPPRVYCEHGALLPYIKKLQKQGRLKLFHFPYDPESRYPQSETAMPSAAQIRDLNIQIKDLPGTWADYTGSEHLEAIRATIGRGNRRDGLHLDSAVKSGCVAFVTCDRDILDSRDRLEAFLDLRIFDPEADRTVLEQFLDAIKDAT